MHCNHNEELSRLLHEFRIKAEVNAVAVISSDGIVLSTSQDYLVQNMNFDCVANEITHIANLVMDVTIKLLKTDQFWAVFDSDNGCIFLYPIGRKATAFFMVPNEKLALSLCEWRKWQPKLIQIFSGSN